MKKLIATLASLALVAGACAMPAAAEETYGYGDVTMDGSTDLIDVMAVMDHYNWETVMGLSGILNDEQMVIANVDGNDIIDTFDAVKILRYYTSDFAEKTFEQLTIEFEELRKG